MDKSDDTDRKARAIFDVVEHEAHVEGELLTEGEPLDSLAVEYLTLQSSLLDTAYPGAFRCTAALARMLSEPL